MGWTQTSRAGQPRRSANLAGFGGYRSAARRRRRHSSISRSGDAEPRPATCMDPPGLCDRTILRRGSRRLARNPLRRAIARRRRGGSDVDPGRWAVQTSGRREGSRDGPGGSRQRRRDGGSPSRDPARIATVQRAWVRGPVAAASIRGRWANGGRAARPTTGAPDRRSRARPVRQSREGESSAEEEAGVPLRGRTAAAPRWPLRAFPATVRPAQNARCTAVGSATVPSDCHGSMGANRSGRVSTPAWFLPHGSRRDAYGPRLNLPVPGRRTHRRLRRYRGAPPTTSRPAGDALRRRSVPRPTRCTRFSPTPASTTQCPETSLPQSPSSEWRSPRARPSAPTASSLALQRPGASPE